MRITQTNTTERITKICRISILNIGISSPTTVVLTLTPFERIGGET